MSLFLQWDAQAYEYILQPAGYGILAILFAALIILTSRIGKTKERPMNTKQMVFSAVSIALAIVTSYIKFAELPFGGSITLFSMLFIVLVGSFYGPRVGLTTGIAYGVLQLITGPYVYAPLQVLMDYPLAFGALGLSGFFSKKKNGLLIGYIVGVLGRYIFHVISGYVFFADYAPEGMNPLIYTLGYNMTYILPEMIATILVISLPPVKKAIVQVKKQAIS